MTEVNLLSVSQASESLNSSLFNKFLFYKKIKPKEDEINDLISLTNKLQLSTTEVKIFENFYLGYNIPQISKEFDLLRFGNNYNINIELKRQSSPQKIKTQLVRNQYYLNFLKDDTYSFSYISMEDKFYTLDEDEDLIEFNETDLIQLLLEQQDETIQDIDGLFNPSNYLISPFNSTGEFIDGKYFLTSQQEEFKRKALKIIESNGTSFVEICGRAGTGKTLITFDIAKDYFLQNAKVLIIHCGILNVGHNSLKDDFNWDVIPAKDIDTKDLSKYHLLVVDETQRIYPSQLKHIIDSVKKSDNNCIFSYDRQQCLSRWEINNNIGNQISELTTSEKFELTEKIRTNKEIAAFIVGLFNKKNIVKKFAKSNVKIDYFDNYNEAKKFIELQNSKGWKVINYTPSKKHTHPYEKFAIPLQDNTHGVIGQEFDKVVAVIDKHFYYNNNELSTRDYQNTPYYHPTKMLYQIITRTRKDLNVIVINNNEVLERCLEILN